MARTRAELEEAVKQLRLLNADEEVQQLADAEDWARYDYIKSPAVFSPIPATPGILSELSPMRAFMSMSFIGSTPYFSRTASGVYAAEAKERKKLLDAYDAAVKEADAALAEQEKELEEQ